MQATVEYDHCESFRYFTCDVEAAAANEGDDKLWHALAWNKMPNVGHVVLSPRVSCPSSSNTSTNSRGTGILFRYDETRIERAWISNDEQFVADPMSALGQKPTFALQKAMSALHPIATAKADMKFPNRKFCRSVLRPLQHPILGCGRGRGDPTCDAARGYRTRGRRLKY